MKKWLTGIMITAIMGTCPLSAYAASDNLYLQTGKFQDGFIQQNLKRDYHRKKERKDKEYEEQERKEQERKEQERREQERREQERREQERREQERREQERKDQDWGDHERKDYGWWERDRRDDRRWGYDEREREDARYIIQRTTLVVYYAQRTTDSQHYYLGLGRAVAHQQKARELYQRHFYREAIFHSLRARNLAMQVIKGNRQNWFGWLNIRDEREERYKCIVPRDNELDFRLDWAKVGKDEAMVHIQFNFDID